MSRLTLAERIMAFREGGWTDRLHTVLKQRRANVAEHSWNVANLAILLFPGEVNLALVQACLWHDIPERWVGDSPAPAKRPLSSGRLGHLLDEIENKVANTIGGVWVHLTPEEEEILKFCDMLELVLWAREDLHLGNGHMLGTYNNGVEALRKMARYEEVSGVVEALLNVPTSEQTGWWKEMMNGGF